MTSIAIQLLMADAVFKRAKLHLGKAIQFQLLSSVRWFLLFGVYCGHFTGF